MVKGQDSSIHTATAVQGPRLHDFLVNNAAELIERCRVKVAARRTPRSTPLELENGIALFLGQLIGMLPDGGEADDPWPVQPGADTGPELRIKQGATMHGGELLRHGFTIDQVVHDYGDLCQAITELAQEKQAVIAPGDFGILNIRLDNAIAGAVSEYSRQRDVAASTETTLANHERFHALSREMSHLLDTSIIAVSALRCGSVGFGGATAAALDRSLLAMRALVDRALAELQLDANCTPAREKIGMASFMNDVRVAASLHAESNVRDLTVLPVQDDLHVEGDRPLLAAAVANLLRTAFDLTRNDSHILVGARECDGRVLIEVEAENGSILQVVADELFRPVTEAGAQPRGAAAALQLTRRGVEANGGVLSARNATGRGCVLTIDLPAAARASAKPVQPSTSWPRASTSKGESS